MEIISIKKYKSPKYPRKDEVLANLNLLKKLPERWKNNAYVCAALSSVMVLLLTSCKVKVDTGKPKITAANISVPFFEHGDGRGSYGCVSVAPAVFLSEDEAFSVINEITRKEGIDFTKKGMTLNDIEIPKTDLGYSFDKNKNDINKEYVKTNLELDGYNDNKKIAFEFVSSNDILDWESKNSAKSTVVSYNFIDTAKRLSEKLNEKDKDVVIATFYDPQFDYEKISQTSNDGEIDYDAEETRIKDIIKEDLHKQVIDFISWLKAQKII